MIIISSSCAVAHSDDEIFPDGDKVDDYNEFYFTDKL
jgi:hypothetical protein